MSKFLQNLFFVAATAGLIFANSGCTSKKAEEDQQVVESADIEKIEAEGLDAVDGAQTTDPSLEAALGETTTTTTTTEVTPPPAEVSAAPTLDETSLNTETTTEPITADAAAAMPAETPAPVETPTADVAAATDTATAAAGVELTETPVTDPAAAVTATPTETTATPAATDVVAPKPSGGGLKKVATTLPYQTKDGGWVNTVYVARPNESLADISLKIYGVDKSKDLKKIAENSYLKSRSVKAGDKVYYVSPNRPDDSAKTILYYEDMGMVPETYVAKKGENLRKVSKELLGYDNAWKEIWTSNSVESKTSLKDGETLRYWKMADGSAMASAVTALVPNAQGGSATLIDPSQAPTAATETVAAPPADAGAALPPPPADANANLPPPPADLAATAETASTGDMATAEAGAGLPPPPAEEMAPPPPPPEAVAAAPKKINLDEAAAAEEESSGELDSDTLMSMGALGVLVALLAYVIIRKKKQKASSAQMAEGQMNA